MDDAVLITDSALSRWGTRPKLISFVLLLFSFAAVKSLALLLPVILITLGLVVISKIPPALLLRRLRLPAFFVGLMALLLLFFSSGEAMMVVGPLTITREGLGAAALITVRCVAILSLVVVLFGTTPFMEIMAALQSLGVSEIFTDMLLFTYRYICETALMLRQMNTAMGLRGFDGQKLKSLLSLSYLAATILIRSYEQSQRVFQAMVLRGYGKSPIQYAYRESSRRDQAWAAACLCLALSLGGVQAYLFYLGV